MFKIEAHGELSYLRNRKVPQDVLCPSCSMPSGPGRDRRARPTEDSSAGADEGPGKGVEQRWSRNRPEEAYGADRPEALFAIEMDSRAHSGVVGTEQEDELRNYERLPESGEAFSSMLQ
jgi:hypothetical protein